MIYRVIIARHFEKQCTLLKKKYPCVLADIKKVLHDFRKESARSLGVRLYKIRVRSTDIRRGKSGGFRAIVLLIEVERILIPVAIYAKSDRETLSEKELEYHLSMVIFEIRETDLLLG